MWCLISFVRQKVWEVLTQKIYKHFIGKHKNVQIYSVSFKRSLQNTLHMFIVFYIKFLILSLENKISKSKTNKYLQ